MSLWFRKCPCCQQKIPKISMLTRNMHYACKEKENYKCMHCPNCHKQISKPYHLFSEMMLGGLLLVLFFGIGKYTVSLFSLPPRFPEGLLIIPIVLVCLIIVAYLYTSLVSLKCYEMYSDTTQSKQKDSDNILIEGVLEFSDHVRIDPLEKKITEYLVFSPFYYFLFVVIGLLAVWLYESVLKT